MNTRLTRRAMLAAAAVAPLAGTASAAGFDWKRFNGSQLRFMVSVHPWTEWAQKQLPALEAETGIKVNLGNPLRRPAPPEAAAHLALGSRRGGRVLHPAVMGWRGLFAGRGGMRRSSR